MGKRKAANMTTSTPPDSQRKSKQIKRNVTRRKQSVAKKSPKKKVVKKRTPVPKGKQKTKPAPKPSVNRRINTHAKRPSRLTG